MEAGFVVLIVVVAAAIGVVIGAFVGKNVLSHKESDGAIYVYYSSPDSDPSLLLDYSVPVNDIATRKQILLDVNVIR